MEWLMNPWVIIVIVLSVVIGNLAALKATANMKFKQPKKPITPQEKEDELGSEKNESVAMNQSEEKKKTPNNLSVFLI
ncbi:DUF2897 family protein [Aliivibrio logei]|uniref:DUF2897 domain-containing protein n=1 Tax=Aliivibrio logei 5S-186 TaxID=626086 RepID=A0ABX3B153_ALILO|nr:DUF2897 family protein [Aliivibrio logei]OEF19960.1 hypothetical protein A1Q5_16160 [Aliivibrio logei 5S-186]